MEKIPIAPLIKVNLSKNSMKLALKVGAIHDEMEEQSLSLPETLKLDEETRQKVKDLLKDSH